MLRKRKDCSFGWRGAWTPAALLCSVLLASPAWAAMPAADIDQIRNGSATSPNEPAEWVNGNAGEQNAHYLEGHSIGYRVKMTDLPLDASCGGSRTEPIYIILGHDVKHSDKHALDYLTHFQRLEPHEGFTKGHSGVPASGETIDPTIDTPFAGQLMSPDDTYPIPCPTTGDSISRLGKLQPHDSCAALPANERLMTMWGGDILDVQICGADGASNCFGEEGESPGDLSALKAEARIIVTFRACNSFAVLAWGGHIATREDWGFPGDPQSAGGISGSPYHMRLIDWNLNNLGNQDRSLKAAAVFVPPVCVGMCDQDVCEGERAECCVSGEEGTPPYDIVWSDGTTCPGLNEGQDCCIVFDPASTSDSGTYTARVTDDIGLSNDPAEDCEFVLDVGENPTCNPSDFCLPGTLMANCAGGSGSYNCEWKDASGAVVSSSCNFTPSVEGTYSVVCTDSATDCESESCSARVEEPVFAEAGDGGTKCEERSGDTSFGPLNDAGCTNGDALWSVESQPSAGCVSISDVNAQHPTITFKAGCTGTAVLKLTCSSDETDPLCPPKDDTASFTVNENPTCNPSDFCLPGTLRANCAGGSGSYDCEWKDASGSVVSTSCNFTPSSEGTYSVVCTDSATDCESESCSARVEDPPFAEAGDGGAKCAEVTGATCFGPLTDASCTNGDPSWSVTSQPSAGCVSITGGNTESPTVCFAADCTGDATLKLTCTSDDTPALCPPDDDAADFTVYALPVCVDTNFVVETPQDLASGSDGTLLAAGMATGEPSTSCEATLQAGTGSGWNLTACSVSGNDVRVTYNISDPSTASNTATIDITLKTADECTSACSGDAGITVECEVDPPANVCAGEDGLLTARIVAGECDDRTGQLVDWFGPFDPTFDCVTLGGTALDSCDCLCRPAAIGDCPAACTSCSSTCDLSVSNTSATKRYCALNTELNGFQDTCTGVLQVFPNPTCGITATDTLICDVGETSEFCATPSGGTAPYTVEWSNGVTCTGIDPTDGDLTNDECCITISTPGTYTASITDSAPVTRMDAPDHCFGSCMETLEVENCRCRVTGGGNDGLMPPQSWAEGEDGDNNWTFGGQAGAPSASGDPAFGEWTHHQKSGSKGRFIFHAGTASAPNPETFVTNIRCSDAKNCQPARPAPDKQIDFEGVGEIKNGKLDGANNVTYRNGDLLCFAVAIEDLGEPGNRNLTSFDNAGLCPLGGHVADGDCDKCACADWYTIRLWDCGTGATAYEVGGYIHGGNLQIHPLVGETYDGPSCGD